MGAMQDGTIPVDMSVYAVVSGSPKSVQIDSTHQQVSVPVVGDLYLLSATDQDAYLEFGSNPTAVIGVDGFDMSVPMGSTIGPLQINDAKISVIGTLPTTGWFCLTKVSLVKKNLA